MKSVKTQSSSSGGVPSSAAQSVRNSVSFGPDAEQQLARASGRLESLWQGSGASPIQLRVLFGAAVIAMGVAVYLAYTSFTSGSVAGCGGGLFDCESVLKSRWSNWFSIPVSVLAGVNYIGFLVALVGVVRATTPTGRRRRWFWVNLFGFSAGLAGLWFMSLQFFVLKHICPYCMAAHTCGLVISGMLIWMRPIGVGAMLSASSLALVGLGTLVTGQILGPEPVTYEIIEYPESPALESSGEISISTPENSPAEGDDTFLFAPPAEDEFLFEPPTEDDAGSTATDADGDSSLDELNSNSPSGDPIEPAEGDEIESEFQIERETPLTQSSSTEATSPGRLGLFGLLAVRYPWSTLTSGLVMIPRESSNGAVPAVQDKTPEEKQAEATEQEGESQEKPKQRRLVSMSGGSIKLDCAQWPMIGCPDAKYVFVELFDYCCPHCRKTHQTIKQVREQMNGDLGVIVLPVPLNTKCNRVVNRTGAKFFESCELAKLAVAVWRIDPEKFEAFHEWMFTGHDAPRYADALAQAKTLVDPEQLDAQLKGRVVSGYIAKHVEIYRRVGGGTIPKLMFPRTGIVGEYTSARSLQEFIEREAEAFLGNRK